MTGDLPDEFKDIKTKIYTIRRKQVMIDRDLASLYDVETRTINQAVKRNIERFPEEFCFQLTKEEFENWKSQIVIPNNDRMGLRIAPHAFTEQGVAMLSAVLRSEIAIQMSIEIMKAFVSMRHFLNENAQIFHRLDGMEIIQKQNTERIGEIMDTIEFKGAYPKQGIFFNGQVFDAYQFTSDLFKSANSSIIIFDNYIDETVLAQLSKRKNGTKVMIVSKHPSRTLRLDVQRYNQQYPQIELVEFNKAHDRFIIIDEKDVYHIGASLKDLGRKWFAFSKIDIDPNILISRIPR